MTAATMDMETGMILGAKMALDRLNTSLLDSIKRNGGAKTVPDTINVFNDLVANMHQMHSEVIEELHKGNENGILNSIGGVSQ